MWDFFPTRSVRPCRKNILPFDCIRLCHLSHLAVSPSWPSPEAVLCWMKLVIKRNLDTNNHFISSSVLCPSGTPGCFLAHLQLSGNTSARAPSLPFSVNDYQDYSGFLLRKMTMVHKSRMNLWMVEVYKILVWPQSLWCDVVNTSQGSIQGEGLYVGCSSGKLPLHWLKSRAVCRSCWKGTGRGNIPPLLEELPLRGKTVL